MKYLLALLLSLNCSAQVIKLTPANESLYGVGLNTKLNFNGTDLTLTGTGLGTKKVGIIRVKLVVNEMFTEIPGNFIRTDSQALSSLSHVGMIAMRVTFLRSLDILKLHTIIQEFLSNNLTPAEKARYDFDIGNVTNAIDSDNAVYAGKSVIFVISGPNIYYMNQQGNIIQIYSTVSFSQKLMTIWLGNCTDNDCSNLKAALLDVPQVTPRRKFFEFWNL